MKLINIGFGSMVSASRVLAVVAPDSAPIKRVVQDARDRGYKEMLLDTLPQLDSAIRLYRRHGFEIIPCYNDSPVESTVYMGKTL